MQIYFFSIKSIGIEISVSVSRYRYQWRYIYLRVSVSPILSVSIVVNKPGFCETGFCETGFCETGFCETGFGETGFCETGFCDVRFGETEFCETGFGEMGLCETGFGETGFGETGGNRFSPLSLHSCFLDQIKDFIIIIVHYTVENIQYISIKQSNCGIKTIHFYQTVKLWHKKRGGGAISHIRGTT